MAMPAQDGATTAISVAQKVQPPAKSGLLTGTLRICARHRGGGAAQWSGMSTPTVSRRMSAFSSGALISDYVSFETSGQYSSGGPHRVKAAFAATCALSAPTKSIFASWSAKVR
jgi:hypothetical protein